MGSNLARLKQWQTLCLIAVFLIAVLLRMVPSIKYGLPYGFDIYEFISRVFVLNEGGSPPLPHGPLFYYIQLIILKAVDYGMFMKILTFLEPIVFTFFVLPPYFVSKQFKTIGNRPVYTLLYAATLNLLVHQIGGVVIPEGLGILFYGLTILFSMKALLGDWRWMLPSMLTGFLTAMSHHLSVFQLILFFMSLLISYFYCFLRDRKNQKLLYVSILIFANIALTVASSVSLWSPIWEDENMLKLILKMIGGSQLLPLLIVGAIIFPLITVRIAEFVKKYEKFTFRKTFVSILLVSIVIPSILAIIFRPDSLPTILWFSIPLSLGFLPFTIHGFIQYCKRGSLQETVFFLAPLMLFMVEASFILLLDDYRTLIYRIPTFVIYFATPLAGYGLSCYSRELNSINKEYLAGLIISYFILSLAFTSYPKPEFAYGVKESISYSELKLAEDAYHYSKVLNLKIDTDNRLGNLLLFLSNRRAPWVGNITSWFTPTNSWLVNVSLSGDPYPPEDDILIILSNAMRRVYGGRVLNLVTKSSAPLNEETVDYLNNYPGIDRLEDTGEGALYLWSAWKKLNYTSVESP